VSEVTLIQDQGQFAAYSTQRIEGVKRKNGRCGYKRWRRVHTCRDAPNFDRAASPWYGRGNFPLSPR